MSRIGRLPVAIPAGVTVEVAANNVVTVTGPKGTLVKELPVEMEIKVEGEEVVVTRPSDLKKMKSLHGLTRTLINNMVVGVTNGYEKVLEVNGVGYRASKSGNKLTLNLGYSHPIDLEYFLITFLIVSSSVTEVLQTFLIGCTCLRFFFFARQTGRNCPSARYTYSSLTQIITYIQFLSCPAFERASIPGSSCMNYSPRI